MKKLIAMLLCIALVLSLSAMVFAAETDGSIRVEAETPTAKDVDQDYNYDEEHKWKVDHTTRQVSEDGLQYAPGKTDVINFAAFDSYTYTFDVSASGKYELYIIGSCDRPSPIDFTVNGTAGSGAFVANGYSGYDQVKLGEVQLVVGSNTMTLTIQECKNHNLYTDAYILVPLELDAVEPEVLPEILNGAPAVDGKLDDMYKESYSFSINNKDFPKLWAKDETDNLEATVYFLHDGEWLYICAVVTGDTAIVDTNKSWPLDGVDVWFLTPAAPTDATRSKITLEAYASPSAEFNTAQHENGLNVDMSKIVNAATQDQANNTYVTEAKLPIPYASVSEGTIVINVQLNNSHDAAAPSAKGSSYGEQYGGNPTTIVLSDTAAVAPQPPVGGDTPPVGGDTPPTGDIFSVVIGVMAVSALGIAVVNGKKKEF